MGMPSVEQGTVRAELTKLFLAASAAAAQRLRDLGLTLTVPVTQQVITRDSSNLGQWQRTSRQVEQNILTNENFALYRYAPLLNPEVAALASQCAAQLVKMEGAILPFFAPVGSTNGWMLATTSDSAPPNVDYAVDAATWTERHVLLPALLEHLKALASLDAANVDNAASFADEVISFTQSNRLSYTTTIPIAGIAIATSRNKGFSADGVRLYPLSAEEQGKLYEEWGVGVVSLNPFQPLPSVALEIEVLTGRNSQNPDMREQVAKWLCALQLNGYTISGRTAHFEPSPRWFMPMSGHGPLSLPSMVVEWQRVTPAAFERLKTTAVQLKKYNIIEPRSARDFALHRFSAGASRQNSADALVDFVVALESLLLPYDPNTRHGDLGYRFRMHGAYYLSRTKTKNSRVEVFKQLRDLYGLRSGLVHGGDYPSPSAIEAGRTVAGALARRGLLRALSEGYPKPETFNAMLLGA